MKEKTWLDKPETWEQDKSHCQHNRTSSRIIDFCDDCGIYLIEHSKEQPQVTDGEQLKEERCWCDNETCVKCSAKYTEQPKESDWKKRFKREILFNTGQLYIRFGNEITDEPFTDEVIQFISTLLQSQREQIMAEKFSSTYKSSQTYLKAYAGAEQEFKEKVIGALGSSDKSFYSDYADETCIPIGEVLKIVGYLK